MIVGGFAVVANEYVRATEDVDFLIPEDADNDRRCVEALGHLDGLLLGAERPVVIDDFDRDHIRASSRAGLVDFIREEVPPLDFDTVAGGAHRVETEGGQVLVAALSSLVAMKRLAGRPQDLADLHALEEIHGPLPTVRVPGLDEGSSDLPTSPPSPPQAPP